MIRVGTSGWSHPEWVGPVYPVALRGQPHAWLRAYAARFRTVEIGSTFDAFPDEPLVASWAREGVELAPFEFNLVLPREATHDALVAGDVERAWSTAARFERHVLEPLADEGLLGAVFVRLPPAFAPLPANVDALVELLRALSGRSVAIEASDAWADVPAAFDGRDVCLVETDALRAAPPPARHACARLHAGSDLARWAERARAHEAAEREVRVVLDHAPDARGAANALNLMALLGQAPPASRLRLTEQQKLPV